MRCEWEEGLGSGALLSPALLECYMNASLGLGAPPSLARLSPIVGRMASFAPNYKRWHLETQDRLLGQLRRIWADDRPRLMIDLGCHAGHSAWLNVSDATLFLDYFNHSGSAVIVADAFEDFALDMVHRLNEVEPYSRMGVEATGVFAAMNRHDDRSVDMRGFAQTWVACCAGKWCSWKYREAVGDVDHYCRITRQRLGLNTNITGSLSLPPSSFDADLFLQLLDGTSPSSMRAGKWDGHWHVRPYMVSTMRADTLWRRYGRGRHVDFIKIDVDQSWKQIGIEGLLEERAFSVMVIEVDGTWGGVLRPWNVSAVDQLAWFARRHGYSSYLKVRCRAAAHARSTTRMEPNASNWYFPLAEVSKAFAWTTRYNAMLRATVFIQDILILDGSQPELLGLHAMAKEECHRTKIALHRFPAATP